MARLQGVVRTKTAEGKAQLWVLAVFPALMLILFDTVSPGYFTPLTESADRLHHPHHRGGALGHVAGHRAQGARGGRYELPADPLLAAGDVGRDRDRRLPRRERSRTRRPRSSACAGSSAAAPRGQRARSWARSSRWCAGSALASGRVMPDEQFTRRLDTLRSRSPATTWGLERGGVHRPQPAVAHAPAPLVGVAVLGVLVNKGDALPDHRRGPGRRAALPAGDQRRAGSAGRTRSRTACPTSSICWSLGLSAGLDFPGAVRQVVDKIEQPRGPA